ncbi:glycosyltransferase family 2 protein [Leptothoe sp. ISB3NOV94-8A]
MLSQITPVILTYNEEPNIERILEKLDWADRIVVIDSYSTDNTLGILVKYPKVDVFKRKFDSYAPQWNYGLDQVETDWILSLDSDYVLPDDLIAEIKQLKPEKNIDGYFARFKYCVFGKPLRGTILPPRQILSRKGRSSYINDGHTQLLQVVGDSGHLKNYIHHDDRKALSRWLWAQDRYMLIEVKKLRETSDDELSMGDRIRKKKVLAPFVIFIYCLILKGGVLDGWRGWYYAFQRMFAELLLSLRLIEKEA